MNVHGSEWALPATTVSDRPPLEADGDPSAIGLEGAAERPSPPFGGHEVDDEGRLIGTSRWHRCQWRAQDSFGRADMAVAWSITVQ